MLDIVKSRLASIVVALMVVCWMVPAAAAQTSSANSSSPELSRFFADYFEEWLKDEPEFATNVGRHEYDDRWSDLSKQGRDLRRAHLQKRFDELQKFPTAGLSDGDLLSVHLLGYDLHTQLDALDLETYLLRVGQMFGAHNRVYVTVDRMPAFTVKDCENIIARLHAMPAYVDQNIEIMNDAITRGLTQPKIVSDLVIGQLKVQAAAVEAVVQARRTAAWEPLPQSRFPSCSQAAEESEGREALWLGVPPRGQKGVGLRPTWPRSASGLTPGHRTARSSSILVSPCG